MSYWITTYYIDDDGNPVTGLTPTLRIRDLSDNSLVVTDAAMTEIGDGGYKYDFTAFSVSKSYQFRSYCGTSSSISNKYNFAYNMGGWLVGAMYVTPLSASIEEQTISGTVVDVITLEGVVE